MLLFGSDVCPLGSPHEQGTGSLQGPDLKYSPHLEPGHRWGLCGALPCGADERWISSRKGGCWVDTQQASVPSQMWGVST